MVTFFAEAILGNVYFSLDKKLLNIKYSMQIKVCQYCFCEGLKYLSIS